MFTPYYNYLSSFFFTENNENNDQKKDNDDFIKIGFISVKDLKSVNLTPVKGLVPNPSRNAPPCFNKVDLRNLNKAQLNSILSVKLKPTPKFEKIQNYEIRHPCLRELLKKRNIIQ
jgi:hypothetical protein